MDNHINCKKDMGSMKVYWNEAYLKEQLAMGKAYHEIARENSIGKSTIHRALSFYGLTKRSFDWSKQELETLKRVYGKTSDLEKHFPNRTLNSIYHKANRLGLENLVRFRKYAVNEGFFQEWTKEMAYILGWMFSDGNVSEEKGTFRIKLSIKDAEVLENFRAILKTEAPLYSVDQVVPSKKYIAKYKMLRINSRKMCQDLIRLGCVPNKMHKFVLPEMPKPLISHFVRGYFDGDGCISFNYPNTIKVRIVSSNQRFIVWLCNIIEDILNIPTNCKKTSTVKNLWQCEYYGDNARKFCDWMYLDSEGLNLKRKKIRFLDHLRKREADLCD